MVLMGPPGAGKGTQAPLLRDHFKVAHISSGDLLREAVRRRTRLGVQAKRFMDRGELVPDEILLSAIEERLSDADCNSGFILDGFPRTMGQATALDALLEKTSQSLDNVTSITVPREELVKRLGGRRVCRNCSQPYHIIYDPPLNAGSCNKCQGELYQRDDDQEDTILARLDVYDRETAPLLNYYRQRGVLHQIGGVGSPNEVLSRILGGESELRP